MRIKYIFFILFLVLIAMAIGLLSQWDGEKGQTRIKNFFRGEQTSLPKGTAAEPNP